MKIVTTEAVQHHKQKIDTTISFSIMVSTI